MPTMHLKIAQICKNTCIFFPWISSLSSNRKAQNSPSPFQFETSDRELTPQPTKSTKFEYSHTRISRILQTRKLFETWDQRIYKTSPEIHKFWPECTHWPQNCTSHKPGKYHPEFRNVLHPFKTIFSTVYTINDLYHQNQKAKQNTKIIILPYLSEDLLTHLPPFAGWL